MQTPIIFNFKRKTVTKAGDPKVERALRDLLNAQRNVVMTGPGTPQATKPAN